MVLRLVNTCAEVHVSDDVQLAVLHVNTSDLLHGEDDDWLMTFLKTLLFFGFFTFAVP